MTNLFKKVLNATLAVSLLFSGSMLADARGLQNATTKVVPTEVTKSHHRQIKEQKLSLMPPKLMVNNKTLQSRKHVLKYRSPLRTAPALRTVSAADAAKIYGCMIYNSTWTDDNQPYGIY